MPIYSFASALRLSVCKPVLMVLLLALASACKSTLAPAPPAASYSAAPAKTLEPTTLNIPVELEVAFLQKVFNDALTNPLFEDNSLDDNGGDNLMIRVQKRLPLQLSASGNMLDVTLPVHIWAKVGYRVDKFGITIGKYEEVDFDVDVRFGSKVALATDWKLSTKTSSNGYTWVKKPAIELLGIKIPVTYIVEKVLDEQLPEVAKIIDKEIAKNFDVKTQMTSLWRLMQEPVLVNETYRAWLKLVPKEAIMAPFDAKAGKLRLVMGISAIAETQLGEKPMVAPNPNLPNLRLVPKPDERFDVALLARIPWAEARRLALQQVLDITFRFQNDKYSLKILDLEMYGQGDQMVVGATIAGTIQGKIFFKGIPIYNTATQSVLITKLDYDLKTKNKIAKSADWLMHSSFIKTIEPYFQMSIEPQLAYARQAMRQSLVQNKIRKDITLTGQLDDIQPEAIYVVPEGLNVIVNASGKIAIQIKQD